MADELHRNPDRPILVEIAGGERRPDPDPTVLTTQAVERASEQWRRDLDTITRTIETRLMALSDRLDAMEAARKEYKEENQRNFTMWTEMQQRAIDKSEKAFTDQLSQLDKQQDGSTSDLRRSIDDVKGRITTIEGQKTGAKDNTAWIAAIAALFVAMLAIMGWVASHNGSSQPPISVSPSSASAGPRLEVK